MSWKLNIGIHKGTRMSRDIDSHHTKFSDSSSLLESLEDCIQTAAEWRANYASLGYNVYIADAYSPEGEVHKDIIPLAGYPAN